MLRLYTCVSEDHDIRLVALAGLICLLSCYTAFSLAARTRGLKQDFRLGWSAAAAIVTGCGVWATHFVAMLAFSPGVPVGYAFGQTALSIVVAILMSGVGWLVAQRSGHRWLGGALIGAAIGSMHYLGMAALRVPAIPHWNNAFVLISLAAGIGGGAVAVAVAARNGGILQSRLMGSAVLAAAIIGIHFIGMAALTLEPDSSLALPDRLVAPDWLAVAIAAVTFLIIALGLLGAIADQHMAQRTERDAEVIRQSEARLRLLFDSNPLPMCVYDTRSLEFLEVNDAAICAYGFSRATFQAMRLTDIVAPDDHERLQQHLETVDPAFKQATEWRHRLEDGRSIDVDVFSHAIVFADRQARLAIFLDVTSRKTAELQLRQAQKLETLGTLAGGIAHEINTPIQYIGDNLRFLETGFADVGKLLDAGDALCRAAEAESRLAAETVALRTTAAAIDLPFLRAEIPPAIAQSLDGVDRVGRIVLAVKEFAHPDVKETQPLDLNHAIENTIAVSRNQWKYVAEVVTELACDLPLVPCRGGEFNQVVLNLIVNASHAIAAKGDGIGTITISSVVIDRWVEIRVADTGTGIPKELLHRIFDPFFTTKEPGKGTGQGLAICHSIIVQKHGGSLHVESVPGQGTVFSVRLPLETATDNETALSAAA